MGLLTVKGTYRDGKAELDETPESVQNSARVLEGMNTGFRLGGAPYLTREEIYDERISRLRR
jgi:hypothetical protein